VHECSKAGEIDSIKVQNADQFARITKLEEAVSSIRADLIGVSGNNGLRGEFRRYREASTAREEKLLEAVEQIRQHQSATLKWMVGVALGVPSVIGAILAIIGTIGGAL
jgi:hypothetical protein